MKETIITLLLVGVILISGCVSQNEVVCNSPYIRVGTGCCLDRNGNNICDSDEDKTVTTERTTMTTTKTAVTCSPCFGYFAYVDYSAGTLLIRNGGNEINIKSVVSDPAGASTPTTTQYDPGEDITIQNIPTSGDVRIAITYDIVGGLTGHTDTATIHNPS